MELDITRAQMNRGALVASFLDITLDQWHDALQAIDLDMVPQELNDPLVTAIESLTVAASDDVEPMSVEDLVARGNYLQALASLSDDALRWIAENITHHPLDLI